MIKLIPDSESVLIQNLTIQNSALFRCLAAMPESERLPHIETCLLMGSQVLEKTQQAREVAWFRNEMSEHGRRVSGLLDRQLETLFCKVRNDLDPENKQGVLLPLIHVVREAKTGIQDRLDSAIKELQAKHDALTEQIEQTFNGDRKTSHLSVFQGALEKSVKDLEDAFDPSREGTVLGDFTRRLDLLLRERFAQDAVDGPLSKMKAELVELIQELRSEMRGSLIADEIVGDLQQKLPGKGIDFEEDVVLQLSGLASARNDVVEGVGTTPGPSGSKKGDIIYSDSVSGARIVVEVKDYESGLSPNRIRTYMEESIQNRDADYGIFLVRSRESLPTSFGSFHVEPRYLVCTVEFLEVAVKFALIQLQSSWLSKKGAQVDLAKVNRHLQAATQEIVRLDAMMSSCGTAQKAIARIADSAAQIKAGLQESLGAAQAILAGEGSPAGLDVVIH